MEDTEVGRGGMSGSEEGVLMAKLVVDEETDQLKLSDDDDDDDAAEGIRRDVKPKKNDAAAKIALAVAATATVELINLFFLHGETERERWHRCCEAGLTALEALTVLFAFAAFLLSVTVVLLRRTAQHRLLIIPEACGGVLLAASAASLFVASVGTVFSLLHAQGHLQFGASARATLRSSNSLRL